jgi:hypothetical protein|tara:strand:- start:1543 stop:2148 length:606 start_codon:yes stop_codon:yes gene_type:complete
MATTKNLRGFLPARKLGSGANSTGMSELPIASGLAANIFTGDTVHVTLGNVEPVTVGGTSALDTPIVIGVFQGCHYIENGEPKWSKHWPSGTSATNARAMVITDPDQTYYIQADASCSAAVINVASYGLTVGAGNTRTGDSGFGIAVATSANRQLSASPIAAQDVPGNDLTVSAQRAFPIFEVRLAHHLYNKPYSSIVTID